MSDSYKVTLPCTRVEAEALQDDPSIFVDLDPVPVLVTSEPDETRPDDWQVDAYFEGRPDRETVSRLIALIPSAERATPVVEKLPPSDWLTISQQGIAPVRAGRFFVHTATNAHAAPAGTIALRIDAGLAFGTGTHETTAGCLEALDRLRRRGRLYGQIADIGTGTGLLAFAALHLWPQAHATASDIDPVSIAVARDNARINAIRLGRGRGALTLCVASGTDHPTIAARAPYDLIVANILAGPLIELAPGFARAIAPGGTLILAGLLADQADRVAAAYRRVGFRLDRRGGDARWPTLELTLRQRLGWRRPQRERGRTSQAPGDFGTW